MIRRGFYAATSVADSSSANSSADIMNFEGYWRGRIHARHCFDYLRQTVQCTADTNLEPVNFDLKGVNGWTKHICKDFDAVRRIAAERRPDLKSIIRL